jgi:prepilin-type N-terminal cleavage/methylation domain-containing protein
MLIGPKRRSGFTLIELLIVIAIILILIAIALPNFLEAQQRSKVTRFMADIRTCGIALDSYAIDYNKYPKADKYPAESDCAGWEGIPDEPAEGFLPRSLTTPVKYVTSLPVDIFPEDFSGAPEMCEPEVHSYHYACDTYNQIWFPADPDSTFYAGRVSTAIKIVAVPAPGVRDTSVNWVTSSYGPDRDHDDFESAQGYPTPYNPTNGTRSDGDFFLFGPGKGVKY